MIRYNRCHRYAHGALLPVCALFVLVSTSGLALLQPSSAFAVSLASPNVRGATTPSHVSWGNAETVAGVLDGVGYSQVDALSCASAGNCAAGGEYLDSSGDYQAFVVSEKNGKWGKAVEVPGTEALNAGDVAWTEALSCRSAGNCSAGGEYTNSSTRRLAFVVNEKSGKWGDAEAVPGVADANGYADLYSLSCASVGNCVAGGTYQDGSGYDQGFVLSETGGTWNDSQEVPGTATLNAGGFAQVYSVSCASVGKCSAGGDYQNAAFDTEVFVVNETNGTWGNAIEAPGTATLNAEGDAGLASVSCGSSGSCAAGGFYTNADSDTEVFVVSEKDGKWGTAIEVPGTATLNSDGDAARPAAPTTKGVPLAKSPSW
jgi:hypothetical protein